MPTRRKQRTAIELAFSKTLFMAAGVRCLSSQYVGGIFGWYKNRKMMNGKVSTIDFHDRLK